MAMPRFEPIGTTRLVVRPMRADDADALWRRRNDRSTARYQNWTLPYPRERARELVDEMVGLDGRAPVDGWLQLAIDDVATGAPLGDLALGLTFGGRCAGLGWTIDESAQGRGIATEAAGVLARWLFEVVGVTRIHATMHPENLASVRVAERIGMVFEGHTRNSYWVGDENSDDWILAMTPTEWHTWNDRPRDPPTDVDLVVVTPENLDAVAALATHRSQQRFVSPMARSFANALVPESHDGNQVLPWFRAIMADGDIAGFVMIADVTAGQPVPYLWRLLIDRRHQRRGIGGRAVDLVLDHVRAAGAAAIEVSWVDGIGSPRTFYEARGFTPTGEIDDGEVVARLDLRPGFSSE